LSDQTKLSNVLSNTLQCHHYLSIPFGPFMNFIIGHNGSGKSAILTALTLCLGGKASSTRRGNAMKSFIKEGTEYVHNIFLLGLLMTYL
ncbi:hypothetical protein BDD12DRAFT_749252, partial [Trichophaea hybrida]